MSDELTHWQKLKAAGIERPYNRSDVESLLKNEHGCIVFNLDPDKVYSVDFQNWFIAGMRGCDKHQYKFVWHACVRPTCRKCHPETVVDVTVPLEFRLNRFAKVIDDRR